MATNLDIQIAINKAIEDQKKLLIDVSKVMKGQLALAIQTAAAISGKGEYDKTQESLKNLSSLLKDAGDAAEEYSTKSQGAAIASGKFKKELDGMAKKADGLAKGFGVAAIAMASIEGASKGFQLTSNALSGLSGIVETVVGALFDLAKTVISFPFDLWNGLFSKAAGMAGSSAYRQALEDIRKAYGDLATGSSKAIIKMGKDMKGQLDETGLRVRRIFGNRAEVLQWVTGVAKSLGNMFQMLRDKGALADKDIERFGALYKGLGITEEGMKAVGREALLSGKTVVGQLTEMANYAIQMGKAFGINAKEIGKDMQAMMLDLKHFGGMSKKALGEASIYARKLGMDVKDLTGLLDTFDTLDTAMEASAKLNQALGLNLNGLELMNAAAKGGPAAVADAVRKSMKDQGFSIASLNRQQLNMMASTTGLTQEQLLLLDVQKNKGESLSDIKKKGDQAAKQQISQAEATKQLANSIERLVKEMEPLQKGLFTAFFDGFQKGVFRGEDFRRILLNIRQVLMIVTRAGMEVGRAFVQMMPGVKDIFRGLGDLFDPERWRKMMRKVIDVFKGFFKDMQTNPEAGLKTLFKKLKEIFFDHFSNSTSAGMKVVNGFKTFFTAILKAVVGGAKAMIPVIMSSLTDLVKGITGFLKGDVPESIKNGAGGILGSFLEVLQSLWGLFKESWPALKSALVELMDYLGDELMLWASNHKMLIAKVLGVMFAPVILGAVINSSLALIAGLLTKGLLGTFKSVASSGVVKKGMTSLFTGATGTNPVPGTPSVTRPPGGSPPNIAQTLKWAAYIAIGMAALVLAVVTLANNLTKWAPNLTAKTLALSIAAILGAGLILAEISALAIVVAAGSKAASKATQGLLPFGLFVVGVTALMLGMIWSIGQIKVDPTKMLAGAAAMGIMTIVLMAMLPLAGVAIAFSLLMSSGPIALVGSAMILSGLAAMGALAVKVIDTAKQIIAAAATIDMSGGIEGKVALVLSIVNALGGFARSIASVLRAMPSIPEGNTKAFSGALTTITNFIDNIKGRVLSFVDSVKDIASTLKEPEMAAIAAVVTIVGTLTTTIATISEVFEKANAGSNFSSQAETFNNIDQAMRNFLVRGGPMHRLISGVVLIVDMFKGIPTTTDPATLKAMSEAVTTVLDSVVRIVSVLASRSQEFDESKMKLAKTFITTILDSLFKGGGQNNIILMITSIMDIFSKAAIDVDAAQLPKIKAFAELVGNLLGSMASLLNVLAPLASMPIPTGGSLIGNMDALKSTIVDVVNSIKDFLPGLIAGIRTATAGISVKELQDKVNILTSVVKFVGELSGVLSKLSWTMKNADAFEKGGQGQIASGLRQIQFMFTGENSVFVILKAITDGIVAIKQSDVDKINNIPDLSRAAKRLQGLADITSNIAKASTNISSIGDFTGTLSNLSTKIDQLTGNGDIMAKITNFLGGDTKGPGHGLIGMVDSVNKLNRSLSSLSTINIDAKLKSIGTILGIKGEQLTIQNKNFTIAVNLDVHMDAVQIENVIADRATAVQANLRRPSRFNPSAIIDDNPNSGDG